MKKTFKPSPSHWDKGYSRETEKFGYKTIVITSPIQGTRDLRFGRLIQVRKNSGIYGTDTILLRESDGKLYSYHNMSFFSVKKEFEHLYLQEMSKFEDLDGLDHSYDIENKNVCVGFVITGVIDFK